MVIATKIKPGENLTDEIFYHRKIPDLRYLLKERANLLVADFTKCLDYKAILLHLDVHSCFSVGFVFEWCFFFFSPLSALSLPCPLSLAVPGES